MDFCVSNQTAYQFNGCYSHGHPCSTNNGVSIHSTKKIPMKQIYDQTVAHEEYLHRLGYNVKSVCECQWKGQCPSAKGFKSF